MNLVDLHVHSDKSDGSLSPCALVDLALLKGLSAFALTDHDTTAGLQEAMAAGQAKGIEVIPGIEFSTEYGGRDIHIVGLFLDENAPAFRRTPAERRGRVAMSASPVVPPVQHGRP